MSRQVFCRHFVLPGECRVCELEDAIRKLINELDCRIEHGAEGAAHLRYFKERLAALVK